MKSIAVEARQTCNNGQTYVSEGLGHRVTAILSTSGDGYWSNTTKSVEITALEMPYINDEETFGELRVYFNTDTWNTQEHGLIYTDEGFIRDLEVLLIEWGLAGADVNYSEQGLQGDNYVSLDVGEKFIQSWNQSHQV